MSSLGNLGSLNVVFSQTGLPGLQAAIDTVKAGLGKLVEGLKTASLAVTGFVTAGIAASQVGEQLSFYMGELSRSIAGLFGPEIREAIGFIRDLTTWIRSLSEAQKDSAARWLEVGAAVAAFATGNWITGIGILLLSFDQLRELFGKIMEALQPIFDVGGKLFDEMIDGALELVEALSGPLLDVLSAVAEIVAELLDLLRPIVQLFLQIAKVVAGVLAPVLHALAFILKAIAAAIKWIVDGLKWLFGIKDEPKAVKHKGSREQETPKLHGPEGLEEMRTRLNQAALKLAAGQGGGVRNDEGQYRQESVEALQKIAQNTGALVDADGRRLPPFKQ